MGLATLATSNGQLKDKLRKLDFEALSLLGVNKHVRVQWRTIPREFGGIGLYSLEVEQTIGWINMILQHYNVNNTLGQKCRMSLECLQLEIGCAGNPLEEKFAQVGHLATNGWWKAVWERSEDFKFNLVLDYPTQPFPRERDQTLISVFLSAHVSKAELRILNRCRIALRSIFLSDITRVCGRRLEPWAYNPTPTYGRESKFTFPREYPSAEDWRTWKSFWTGWLHRDSTYPLPLGKWINGSHQKWTWFHDPRTDNLIEIRSGHWTEYTRLCTNRQTRGNASYTPFRSWILPNTAEGLLPASVSTANNILLLDVGRQLHIAPSYPRPSFWDFVHSFGGRWMWQYVEGDSTDVSWLHEALVDGSAVMVTDGSYNQSLAPDISGAGWIISCTQRRRLLGGWFYERSPKAGSYRGELLGAVAIHLLTTFIVEYFSGTCCKGQVHCDN